ncbi:MAG: aminotransferase class I/II-fold pyridoxal phosphate-dependent enzyme [Treponema sp.]|nr:aminotransferase class I/II-fold pyridoxal phosphate-dependent enzyme [Treponema sp.]
MKRYFKLQEDEETYIPSLEEHWDRINLHLNENFYNPPISADFVNSLLDFKFNVYERGGAKKLKDKLAEMYDVNNENILISNGSCEVLKHIFISIKSGSTVLLPSHTWAYYPTLVKINHLQAVTYDLTCDDKNNVYKFDIEAIKQIITMRNPSLVLVVSPNAFTGNLISGAELSKIAEQCGENALLVVDQAYVEFAEDDDIIPGKFIKDYPNTVFTRTFSKFYALANTRVGYAVSGKANIACISKYAPAFGTSGLSQRVALEVLRCQEYYSDIKSKIADIRDRFTAGVNKLKNFKAYKSSANYVLIKAASLDAGKIINHVMEKGIMLGDCKRYGLEHNIRVTIGEEQVMNKLLEIFTLLD